MIIYHGSNSEITKPDVFHSRRKVDFGSGFYVTTMFEQAQKWSNKFKTRGMKSFVNEYVFDDKSAKEELRILEFDSYSDKWLDCIVNCRKGLKEYDYDIIIGGVADDKVFDTVELYLEGLVDKKEAIKKLKYTKPNVQMCFKTQEAIDKFISFKGSKEI